MNILRLIRFPNLLIIAATQYLLRHALIIPILDISGVQSSVSGFNFFLLVLSTTLTAAGGYIINDYKDYYIDRINKPSKVIAGVFFSRKFCFTAYLLVSASGFFIASYLSLIQNMPFIMMISLLSNMLLWIYSDILKNKLLTGNIAIAFLTGLCIMLVALADINAMHMAAIMMLAAGYAAFAFLLTIVRELIKDLEDKEGDEAYGRRTLPVMAGNTASKILILFFIMIILFSLAYIQYLEEQWKDRVSFLYVAACVEIPLIILAAIVYKAADKKTFGRASMLSKGIMIAGILSMIVFYYRSK